MANTINGGSRVPAYRRKTANRDGGGGQRGRAEGAVHATSSVCHPSRRGRDAAARVGQRKRPMPPAGEAEEGEWPIERRRGREQRRDASLAGGGGFQPKRP